MDTIRIRNEISRLFTEYQEKLERSDL